MNVDKEVIEISQRVLQLIDKILVKKMQWITKGK